MKTVSDFQYHIQQSRSQITQEYAALIDALDVTKTVRHSIQKKPWPWLSTSFLTGLCLPWLFKKSTPSPSQELPSALSLPSEKKKKSSLFSNIALIATPLLQNKALRSSLISTAYFVFPLIQEAMMDFASRKKNKKQGTAIGNF